MTQDTKINAVGRTAPTLDWHSVPSRISEGAPEVRHADGWLVCETCSDSYARLMAAAPAMLAALKRVDQFLTNGIELGYIRLPQIPDPALDTPGIVRRAIAKAEGRAS